MKTLSIILSSIAMLAFSGCYTQLLIEDTTYPAIEPIHIPPPPPPPSPWPYHPTPTPNPDPQPIDNPHRESGYQRSPLPSSQDNSRNTGARRSGEGTEVRSPQQNSQDNAHIAVPIRGSERSEPRAAQEESRSDSRNSGTTRRGER
jgi:hypothetical protein